MMLHQVVNAYALQSVSANPLLAAFNNTVYGSAGSQAITLPSDIQAGDIIVVFVWTTNGGTLSSSAGWTHTNYANWGAGDDACVTWKVAAGGDTLTIGATTSCFKNAHAFVIRGADTGAGVNQAAAFGTNNPPSVNIPGGIGDGIVLVVVGQQSQAGRTTGPPSGYTTGVIPDGYNKGGSACKTVSGVTSEDPGAFVGSLATYNVALSAAIRAA